jgi:plasmid stabilization system protein ParE
MSCIRFDPDARAEFLGDVEYYEGCQPGLGRRFREAVEAAFEQIGETPFRFRVYHDPFRRCLLKKFPHAVIYSIEPEFILVIAVAHLKRKPGYWHDRIARY